MRTGLNQLGWLAWAGFQPSLANASEVPSSPTSVTVGFFVWSDKKYRLKLLLSAVAVLVCALVKTQQIKDLTIFEGFSFQRLDFIEHVLSKTQVLVLHGQHCFIVVVHFKDRAFLQA